MSRIKSTRSKLRYLIVPILIVAITYVYLIFGVVGGWSKNNQSHMMEDALNVARVYSMNIEKSMKAKESIFELVEERLFTASTVLIMKDKDLDNGLIAMLAKQLNVDVIYAYNSDGVIEYANTEKYIGWRAPINHPVRSFMESKDIIRQDEIRKDTESDDFFKYSYAKLNDGRFYQIGISETTIQDLLNEFKVSKLLQEIGENYNMTFAHFVDNTNVITESTEKKFIGQSIINEETLEAIESNQEGRQFLSKDKVKSVEVSVPVYLEQNKIGTLIIENKMETNLNNSQKLIRDGLWIILGFFLTIIIFISLIYRENRKRLGVAYIDKITGLPNDTFMRAFLKGKINPKNKVKNAIVLINIPYFRTINMALGVEVADLVIKEVSKRLELVLQEKGELFRFKEDRFVFYVEEYKSLEELIFLSDNIVKTFEKPLKYLSKSRQISSQIGIVEMDRSYASVDDLMKNASIAVSNLMDRNLTTMIFTQDMRNEVDREEMVELDLIRSFNNVNQEIIFLEYQPKINLITNRIVGFEALSRMKSINLGIVSPAEFIDVAEEKNLILPLGTMVLEMACVFTKRLIDQGNKNIRMAVNVSGTQLLEENFVTMVMDIIKRTGIESENLELEITETVLLENYNLVNETLQKLRAFGVEISMDDFGTGFSSLASIGELNIDTVKIDQHFISKIVRGNEENLITKDIIIMAHKLGLQVVGEGVETKIQKEYLLHHGCDIMQGFYFSEPISEKESEEILNDEKKLA